MAELQPDEIAKRRQRRRNVCGFRGDNDSAWSCGLDPGHDGDMVAELGAAPYPTRLRLNAKRSVQNTTGDAA
jgi:hypothetical protein